MVKESRKYRKQILLFFLVFVLPCVVLVILSLRMINQLKLPWEIGHEENLEQQSLAQSDFTQKIRIAEKEELVT